MTRAEADEFTLDPILGDVLADWICGAKEPFIYRSSGHLAPFFRLAGYAPCEGHDGSTRKWWVLARIVEYVDSTADLDRLIAAIADPRHFVVGDAVDAPRWRATIAAMNARLALDGIRVTERGVGVQVERVSAHIPGRVPPQDLAADTGEPGPVTEKLLSLLGRMVVGARPLGQFRGSGGASYFERAGRSVTTECPDRGWEPWASEQLRLWLAVDADAIRKLLEAMANPAEFLDLTNRLKVAEREGQIRLWNGFLVPEGWRIDIAGAQTHAVRVKPGTHLPTEPQIAITETAAPPWAACPASPAVKTRVAERWQEYRRCSAGGANLAAVILLGSIMEALLHSAMQHRPNEANAASAAPKKGGVVKQLRDWTLDDLINVSHDLKLLQRDRKDFASSLRDWRNVVHLRHEIAGDYAVDEFTVRTCENVVRGVVADLEIWARSVPTSPPHECPEFKRERAST